MRNCLVGQKQRSKINQAYSSWEEILLGVLTAIPFNIFLRYLLLEVQDIDFSSWANDSTIYAAGESLDDLVLNLQESCQTFYNSL